MTDQIWWQRPFRVFQTNLREIDAGLDAQEVVATITSVGADTWLLNTGGIVSFYPTKLPFQHPSPWLETRSSGDLIADAVAAAHEHGVHLICRMDFSKTHADIAEAHRDWCFVGADGRPQVYNDLYSTCPSGPYYQERSFEILAEVLDDYDVDGFFFNWFNFNQRDYSGVARGICQCYNCRARFTEGTGYELPSVEDWSSPAYLAWTEFTRRTLTDLAERIRGFIRTRRPGVPLLLRQSPDVIMHEANNAIDRPLPLWVTNAGEMVRRSKGDNPDKPIWVNTVTFIDLPYRFAAEQPGFIALDLVQTFANGASPSSYIIGTPDRADQRILDVTADLFTYHRDNSDLYDGLRPAAKVAVIHSLRTAEVYGGADSDREVVDEYRGAYRALLEEHVPFDVIPDGRLVALGASGLLRNYDALVLPNVAVLDREQTATLDGYVAAGGGLVATYDTGLFDEEGREVPTGRLASLGVERVTYRRQGRDAMRSSYLTGVSAAGVADTNDRTLLALDDGFLHTTLRPEAVGLLPFRSPGCYGPPEKCYGGVDTDAPGLVTYQHGNGRTAYLPWPAAALYYRVGMADYRLLLAAALDRVLPEGRQLTTDAPPQVEATVSVQPSTGRVLVHLVNYTGHQGRAFYDPLELRDLALGVRTATPVSRCRAVRAGGDLAVETIDARATVTLPSLGLFELLVFD